MAVLRAFIRWTGVAAATLVVVAIMVAPVVVAAMWADRSLGEPWGYAVIAGGVCVSVGVFLATLETIFGRID